MDGAHPDRVQIILIQSMETGADHLQKLKDTAINSARMVTIKDEPKMVLNAPSQHRLHLWPTD